MEHKLTLGYGRDLKGAILAAFLSGLPDRRAEFIRMLVSDCSLHGCLVMPCAVQSLRNAVLVKAPLYQDNHKAEKFMVSG